MLEMYCVLNKFGVLKLEGQCLLFFMAALTYQETLWYNKDTSLFRAMKPILQSWFNLLKIVNVLIKRAGCDDENHIAVALCELVIMWRTTGDTWRTEMGTGDMQNVEINDLTTWQFESYINNTSSYNDVKQLISKLPRPTISSQLNANVYDSVNTIGETVGEFIVILRRIKSIVEESQLSEAGRTLFQPKAIIMMIIDYILAGCKQINDLYELSPVTETGITDKSNMIQQIKKCEVETQGLVQSLTSMQGGGGIMTPVEIRTVYGLFNTLVNFKDACDILILYGFQYFDIPIAESIIGTTRWILQALQMSQDLMKKNKTTINPETLRTTCKEINDKLIAGIVTMETGNFKNLTAALSNLNRILLEMKTNFSEIWRGDGRTQEEIMAMTLQLPADVIIQALKIKISTTKKYLSAQARLDVSSDLLTSQPPGIAVMNPPLYWERVTRLGFFNEETANDLFLASRDRVLRQLRQDVVLQNVVVPEGMINTLLDEVTRRIEHPAFISNLRTIDGNDFFSMCGSDYVKLKTDSGEAKNKRAQAIAVGQCLTTTAYKMFDFTRLESLKKPVEEALEEHYRRVFEKEHPEHEVMTNHALVSASSLYTTHFQEVLMMLRESLRRGGSETEMSFTDDILRNVIYNSEESVRVIIARQIACRINLSSDLHPSRYFLTVRYPRLRAESTLLLRMMGRMILKKNPGSEAFSLQTGRPLTSDSPFR